MTDQDPGARTSAMQRAEVLDLLAALVAVVLLVLTLVDGVGVARTLLTLVFAFFVPGRAIVSNWPRMARWSDIGMSIALSLGVLAFLATVTLWARVWHPLGLFQVEAAASLVGLGIALVRRRRLGRGRGAAMVIRKPAIPH
jgi:uncharacterized membrane protein HdeD (DUF308 family)